MTRQPLGPHSTAKCKPDMNVSCGTANWARVAARPMTIDLPAASVICFPANGPALTSRIIAKVCYPRHTLMAPQESGRWIAKNKVKGCGIPRVDLI